MADNSPSNIPPQEPSDPQGKSSGELPGGFSAERKQQSRNPFIDSHDSDLEAPICSARSSKSNNPFEDEDDNAEEMPPDNVNDLSSGKKRAFLNPFDDGDVTGDDSEEVLMRRMTVTESLAPLTLASVISDLASRSDSLKNIEAPSKKFAKEIQALTELGFDKVCVNNALTKTSGKEENARKLLMSRLLDEQALAKRESYLWKSPIAVRIGSWLPKVMDDLGSSHTAYFIDVTMTHGNESWRVGHRYSEFYNFYCKVYSRMWVAFPSGMNHPFPTDRWSNWFTTDEGAIEAMNDTRRKMLDGWMKELCSAPEIILDDETRDVIYEFLQVEENMARIRPRNAAAVAARNARARERAITQAPTPTTSAWQQARCCRSPVMKIKTQSIEDIRNDYSGSSGARCNGIGLNLPLPPPNMGSSSRDNVREATNTSDSMTSPQPPVGTRAPLPTPAAGGSAGQHARMQSPPDELEGDIPSIERRRKASFLSKQHDDSANLGSHGVHFDPRDNNDEDSLMDYQRSRFSEAVSQGMS